MYKRNYSRYSRGRNNRNRRANIRTFDPSRVIAAMKENQSRAEGFNGINSTSPIFDDHVVKNKFSDFPLDWKLAKNIESRGYPAPTPIQDQAIPKIMSGIDVVGVANTGTGKTAAFLIPLINKVILNRHSRVLIITPTRELAVQIDKELQMFSRGLGIQSAICIGGVSIKGQMFKLQRGPNFVIGTPGRLLDLENQRKIYFDEFKSIVLDEVDRILDMGFIKDMKHIISKLPKNRQSLFFSATLDKKTKSVMSSFISDPVIISVKSRDTRSNIHQEIVKIGGRNKADVLCEILDKREVEKSLVFVRTKRGADSLGRKLYSIGFKTAVIHGNRSQNQRQRSLDQFKLGEVNVLVATDVASRGIDVRDITHVINFDLPGTYEDYVHRIGRTGRVDNNGIALSFIG